MSDNNTYTGELNSNKVVRIGITPLANKELDEIAAMINAIISRFSTYDELEKQGVIDRLSLIEFDNYVGDTSHLLAFQSEEEDDYYLTFVFGASEQIGLIYFIRYFLVQNMLGAVTKDRMQAVLKLVARMLTEVSKGGGQNA